MMSQEPHLLHRHHHQHPFNEYSSIAGNNNNNNNNLPSMMTNSFDTAGGQDIFAMEMPNSNWREVYVPETTAPVAAPSSAAWSVEQPLCTNRAQSLSLSLFNPPQTPSFQLPSHQLPFHLKSCKYLLPSQELLNEFCSLGAGNSFRSSKNKDNDSSSSLCHQSLYTMEPLELQKRKAKLLSMLQEVDKRYKRYCDQMKAVVYAFEEIAGDGAARTYSMLASKAMSKHFRCLRDGINRQIKATRRAMGEKDAAAVTPGQTRGETPRLKLLDQCLRQHKAFQHAGMMESHHPWRPQRGLPERSVSILRAWLFEHFLHPYPSDVDKLILARQTGLSRSQVSNWFINARVRLWKPMVEEMYMEELKEEDNNSQSSNATTMQGGGSNRGHPHTNPNPNPSSSSQPHFEDLKPDAGHLHIDDQHSLSSIINSMNTHHHSQNPDPSFGFDTYSGHELTLGLHRHERPLLIGGEEDEVQFSMVEGDGQNIPYRSLVGARLLHDLAG